MCCGSGLLSANTNQLSATGGSSTVSLVARYLVAQMMSQQAPQVLAQQVSKCVGNHAAPWAEVAESFRSHQEQDWKQHP